jgi:tripartite motif-containing protein 71
MKKLGMHTSLLTGVAGLLVSGATWAGKPFEVDYPNLVKPTAQFGTYGSKSGEFNEPSGLTISKQSEIYVSDCFNRRVQVFDKTGAFQRAFILPDAKCPQGVAVHDDGTVLVADTTDRVFVLTKDGEIKSSFGSRGSGVGQFIKPTNIAIYRDNVYVVDEGNNRVDVFSINGKPLLTIGRRGVGQGQFLVPKSVTVDESGYVYVSDIRNRIQKFTAAGKFVKQWGRYGGMPGDMAEPSDVSYAKDTVYVADLVNHRLQAFDTDGKFKLTWGRHPEVMHEGQGRTHYPAFMKASPQGDIVAVCEPFEYRCQVFDTESIRNMPPSNVLAWWQKFPKFHYGGGARMAKTSDVAQILERQQSQKGTSPSAAGGVKGEEPSDILFITEPDIHRVIAFNVNADANKLTPRWAIGSFGSGPGKWGMLSAKTPIQTANSVFIGDAANNVFQEVDLLTGKYKATHFGPGTGPGQFNGPTDLAVAPNGDLYIGDYHNNRIQVFDKSLKYKFEFGGTGDGPGRLFGPMGPTFSPSADKLYVSDTANFRISVFDREGKFLFAFGHAPKPGEWGQGTFLQPFDVAVAPTGEVYVTDPALQMVQKFDANGKFITQWGGWGTKPGQFYKCKGIDIGSDGKVYVIDFGNHRGQIFDPDGKFLGIFGEGVLFPKDALDSEGKMKNMSMTQTNN